MHTEIMKTKVIWLAFALVLGLGAGVAQAQPNWCALCDEGGGCFECCRCGGGSQNACVHACGWPFAGTEVATPELLPLAAAECSAPDAQQLPPAAEAPLQLDAAAAAEPAVPSGS